MTEQLLTVKQVCEILQVERKTVLNRIGTRQLEAVRIGREWRIKPSALNAFINKNTRKAS